MKKLIKFECYIFIIITVGINFILTIPMPTNNITNARGVRSPSNYLEIKLPVKVTTRHELFDWIKNVMKTMASKIDITLGSSDESKIHEELSTSSLLAKDTRHKNSEPLLKATNKSSVSRSSFIDVERPWLKSENIILSPLINAEAFLPLILDDLNSEFPIGDMRKYTYHVDNQKRIDKTINSARKTQVQKHLNNSRSSSGFLQDLNDIKTSNTTRQLSGGQTPFSIPFEAYVTITRETSTDGQQYKEQHQQQHDPIAPITRDPPDDFPTYFKKKPMTSKKQSTIKNNELPVRFEKKENSRNDQITVIGNLLKMLGITKKSMSRLKIQEAATTSTVTMAKPTNKSREEFTPQPLFDFEDPPMRSRKNETSQRQEFDDDDEDYEEEQGSLGSIAELLPLALPIIEDLSNPESNTDLIEVLQAAIPLIQGLSEPDDEGNGGAKELIDSIVPIITKIINGPNGEGSDIGAIIGPVLGLLVPFIGPILAPVIGPLLRAISNPSTEGSSLPALITAISGPLSTPQEPSGMSPLSILIAGTTAAVLKELKPGAPNGSDLGALVGAILSGVIAGTSAGLSGGSSAMQDVNGQQGYGPHGIDLQSPVVAGTINTGFNGRPSHGPPLNSPFNIIRPNHLASATNVGSTVGTPLLNYPVRPSNHAQQYVNPGPTSYTQLQSYGHQHHHGPVSAAATNTNGGSSYLPYASTAVPANSVNPFSLITMTVKDIFGAGIQVVSSLVNAIFGIIGASSQEQPKPSYGPPAAGPYTYTSG